MPYKYNLISSEWSNFRKVLVPLTKILPNKGPNLLIQHRDENKAIGFKSDLIL